MTIIRNEGNKLEIWLKMCDMQDELGVKNVSDLAIKEGICNEKRNNITRQEKEKYKAWSDDRFVYILSDLALTIIMDCRVSTPKPIEFRS